MTMFSVLIIISILAVVSLIPVNYPFTSQIRIAFNKFIKTNLCELGVSVCLIDVAN